MKEIVLLVTHITSRSDLDFYAIVFGSIGHRSRWQMSNNKFTLWPSEPLKVKKSSINGLTVYSGPRISTTDHLHITPPFLGPQVIIPMFTTCQSELIILLISCHVGQAASRQSINLCCSWSLRGECSFMGLLSILQCLTEGNGSCSHEVENNGKLLPQSL